MTHATLFCGVTCANANALVHAVTSAEVRRALCQGEVYTQIVKITHTTEQREPIHRVRVTHHRT